MNSQVDSEKEMARARAYKAGSRSCMMSILGLIGLIVTISGASWMAGTIGTSMVCAVSICFVLMIMWGVFKNADAMSDLDQIQKGDQSDPKKSSSS